jgi:tetratricopeptide (TPR) repeat protein
VLLNLIALRWQWDCLQGRLRRSARFVSRNPYTSAKRLKRVRAEAGSAAATALLPDSLSMLGRLSTMFEEGRGHHQAGRLGEAQRLYRKILELDPRHADSLHLLGMGALQTGHNDAAEGLIRKAIAWNGTESTYHTSLGNVLQLLGISPPRCRSMNNASIGAIHASSRSLSGTANRSATTFWSIRTMLRCGLRPRRGWWRNLSGIPRDRSMGGIAARSDIDLRGRRHGLGRWWRGIVGEV